MQFFALGGAREVGGCSSIIDIGEYRLMFDAGARLETRPGIIREPSFHLLTEQAPDALFLSHAHVDHTGSLPALLKQFPDLPVFATEATIKLMEAIYIGNVRAIEREQMVPEREVPLYPPDRMKEILDSIQVVEFEKPFQPLPKERSLVMTYMRAGHALGAAMMMLDTPEGRVLFTGDYSTRVQRMMPGVNLDMLPQVDTLISEGIYGSHVHKTRQDQEQHIVRTILPTLEKGGRVLFPCSALGRAQELLLMLREARTKKQLPPVPLYIDGLAREATRLYLQYPDEGAPELKKLIAKKGDKAFEDPDDNVFFVDTPEQRRELIASDYPAMIIATSAMIAGGASSIYAPIIATNRDNLIMVNAHLDDEHPGWALRNTRTGTRLEINQREVPISCSMYGYGLSTHANAAEIETLAKRLKPRQMILMNGTIKALESLGEFLKDFNVSVPLNGDKISLPHVHRKPSVSRMTEVLEQRSNKNKPVKLPNRLPTVEELYQSVAENSGFDRSWSALEIAACHYKKEYRPQLRKRVEQVLKQSEPYFVRQRQGSEWVYQPQPLEQIEQQRQEMREIEALEAGDVVLVQNISGDPGPPRLALVTGELEDSSVSLIAETWNHQRYDWRAIKLVPNVGIDLPDGENTPLDTLHVHLDMLREAVDYEAVDLLSIWKRTQPSTLTFEQLSAHCTAPEQRLALGLELLLHGPLLWNREGGQWSPRAAKEILVESKFVERHEYIHQDPTGRVEHMDSRTGQLTGRIHWDTAEVLWDANYTFNPHGELHFLSKEKLKAIESGRNPQSALRDKHISLELKVPMTVETIQRDDEEIEEVQVTEPVAISSASEALQLTSLDPFELARAAHKESVPAVRQEQLDSEGLLPAKRDLRRLERTELVKLFVSQPKGKLSITLLFKNLIWQAYHQIRSGTEEPCHGNIHGFWYRWCVPVLGKLPEHEEIKSDPFETLNKVFSRMASELRLVRYIDFGFSDPYALNRHIGKKHPNILLFSERHHWHPQLWQWHQELGVSVLAVNGTPTPLTTEYTVRELVQACDFESPLHLISLVNYSPSGDSTAQSFRQQFESAGFKTVTVSPLILPEHYSEEEQNLCCYPLPTRQKNRLKQWIEKTGGVDGEPYGLETESLPLARLRDILFSTVDKLTQEG